MCRFESYPFRKLTNSKEQNRIYHRTWYLKNKEKRRKEVHDRRLVIKKWVKDYKSNLKCLRCPESHPATLDFHHLDQNSKIIEIGNAIINGWDISRIEEEISKCVVLCSNCHRKEHYNAS